MAIAVRSTIAPVSHLRLVPPAGEPFKAPRRPKKAPSPPLVEDTVLIRQADHVDALVGRLLAAAFDKDSLVVLALARSLSVEATALTDRCRQIALGD